MKLKETLLEGSQGRHRVNDGREERMEKKKRGRMTSSKEVVVMEKQKEESMIDPIKED